MKGIIVEIQQNMAALLSDDGVVRKVSNRNYSIGQEVEVSMKKTMNWKKWTAVGSAAACLVLVFGIGAYAYTTPYSKVSLDVNPSIEYTLNRFGRVIEVEGKNEDGETIISEAQAQDLKHQSIQDAIANTIEVIEKDGYFEAEGAGIVIATSSEDEDLAKDLANDLKEVTEDELDKLDADATVETLSAGKALVKEANELGVTPGKLNLVKNLVKAAGEDTQIQMQEWLGKSVKEIMAETKMLKEQTRNKAQTKEETAEQEAEQNKEQNSGEDKKNQEENAAQNGDQAGNANENKPEQPANSNGNGNSSNQGTTPPQQPAGQGGTTTPQQPAGQGGTTAGQGGSTAGQGGSTAGQGGSTAGQGGRP